MSKRRQSVLAGLCALALLVGCGQELAVVPTATPTPSSDPTPVVGQNALILPITQGSMNPLTSQDKINRGLVGLIWEGLFVLDPSFQPKPLLCNSYTVGEDGLSWEFTVDTSRAFSNGAPVTAQAVAESLDIARGAESLYQARLSGITGVAVLEATNTVVVTLSAPNGALPSLLTVPIVDPETGLGTGAYVWQEEGLVANQDWWQHRGSSPWVEEIALREIPEADDLIYAFDTGEISLVIADLTSPSALGYGGDNYEIRDYHTTTMEFVGFNCDNYPCSDPLVRQGLSRVFDRETIAVALYARHGVPATLPVHPTSPLYDDTLAQSLAYDPKALEEILGEAGYMKNEEGQFAKGNRVLTLTMVVNTDNDFRVTVAEYLAGELTRLGVEVQLEMLPWADYLKALERGQFDLYLGGTAMTADFNPQTLLTGALNYGDYTSAEMAGLLFAFQSATGMARVEAASALYGQLAEEMPFAPLLFKEESLLSQWALLEGETPTQQNPFYGFENWRFS